MMKPTLLLAVLALVAAPAFSKPYASNTTASHPTRLHFARGATKIRVRAFLAGNQNRFYVLKTNAGQHLKITVEGEKEYGMVPLLFVTPPRGEYDGEKTATYETSRTKAGDYQISIGHNLMASNERSGYYILRVTAR